MNKPEMPPNRLTNRMDTTTKVILFSMLSLCFIVIIGTLFRAQSGVSVGEKVILDNDTLTVIDKSNFGKLKLSNGVDISIESYNKLKNMNK